MALTNQPTNRPIKKKVLRENRPPYAGYARRAAKQAKKKKKLS